MNELYVKKTAQKINFRIWALIIGVIGQALLALSFYYFIPYETLASDIRTLDFIVMSIVFWLWAVYLGIPPISITDRTQKQVGSLGVRIAFVGWYSVLAILFMLYNIVGVWIPDLPTTPFKGQLFVQSLLIFFLIVGIFSTAIVRNKTEAIYHEEQALLNSKNNLKRELEEIERIAAGHKAISPEQRSRIAALAREVRYISPTSSPQAKNTDEEIISQCRELKGLLSCREMNIDIIGNLLKKIEINVAYRKQIM